MNKILQPAELKDPDDVAGLFQRLGDRGQMRVYREFPQGQLQATTAVIPAVELPVPPPVPLSAAVAASAHADVIATAEVPTKTAALEGGSMASSQGATPVVVTAERKTPLEQLFLRLAEVRSAAEPSPLSRLREA
ncbi:MAG: hypothetical protein ACOH1V_09050 [Stenotrophomonas sp.]